METGVKKQVNIPNTDMNQLYDEVTDIGIGADTLINSEIEEMPCLMDPFLPIEGIGVVAGESDIGKSTFLRQLSMAIVSNEDSFLAFKLNVKHGRAIYVSSEDSRYALSKYCKVYSRHFNKNADCFRSLRFVQDSENILTELDKSLKSKPCDLVVMDVFTDFYLGKLNEATNIRAFLRDYFNLSARYGCLILFCHHTGKASRKEQPNKHNLLGSQAIEAKSRVTFELMADPSGNDEKRHLFVTKGNYLTPDLKDDGYELTFSGMIFEPTGNRTPKYLYTIGGEEEYNLLVSQVRSHRDQGLSQKEIAERVNRSQGQVSRILQKLAIEQPF